MKRLLLLCFVLVVVSIVTGCGKTNDSSMENPATIISLPTQSVSAMGSAKTTVCHFYPNGTSKVIEVNNNSLDNFLSQGDCITSAPKATVGCTCSPPSITSFTATPDVIDQNNGEASTLTWTTMDATSCSIDNGIGDVPCNGNTGVDPDATTIYTLTVTGPNGGPITAQTTLHVEYCHTIEVGSPCPSGATEFCRPSQIDRHSSSDAQVACNTCNTTACVNEVRLGGSAWGGSGFGWFFYSDAFVAAGCGDMQPMIPLAGEITFSGGCPTGSTWAP